MEFAQPFMVEIDAFKIALSDESNTSFVYFSEKCPIHAKGINI